MNRFLEAYQIDLAGAGKKGLVVIVDGLEKMVLHSPEDGVNSYADLFINHPENLKAPACHVVYTMPVALMYDFNVGERFAYADPILLPMVKVQDRARQRSAMGVGALRTLLGKRMKLEALSEPAAVDRLVLASGGHVRDLLRLMRNACLRALEGGAPLITEAIADDSVASFGNDAYGMMAYQAVADLVQVFREQHLPKHLGYLAQNLLVLQYCNRESWSDVHPCVAELPRVREALEAPLPAAGGQ